MSKRFKLYNVNIKYIRNLHNVDDNVPSVSPQIGKQARPFLGTDKWFKILYPIHIQFR